MDIADWLRGLGLEKYAPAFDENAINWDVLSELTTDDLKEIGVAALGDRRRLLAAIAALGEGALPAAPAPVRSSTPAEAERRQLGWGGAAPATRSSTRLLGGNWKIRPAAALSLEGGSLGAEPVSGTQIPLLAEGKIQGISSIRASETRQWWLKTPSNQCLTGYFPTHPNREFFAALQGI